MSKANETHSGLENGLSPYMLIVYCGGTDFV